jgi:hypothetical protein
MWPTRCFSLFYFFIYFPVSIFLFGFSHKLLNSNQGLEYPLKNMQQPKSQYECVGAKAKTPPFARCLRRPRCTNGGKTTGRLTLRPTRRRTKTCDEVVSSCDFVQHGGPCVIRPIVTGPAWPLRIMGLICKGLPVITVCNPALWEYSRDNLGA